MERRHDQFRPLPLTYRAGVRKLLISCSEEGAAHSLACGRFFGMQCPEIRELRSHLDVKASMAVETFNITIFHRVETLPALRQVEVTVHGKGCFAYTLEWTAKESA